ALYVNGEPFLPGTRITSPNAVKMTSSCFSAKDNASSTRPGGSTQTGQPGPWMNSMFFGTNSCNPKWNMAYVWPPQTSMMRKWSSGSTIFSSSSNVFRISSGFLNSSMNFNFVTSKFHVAQSLKLVSFHFFHRFFLFTDRLEQLQLFGRFLFADFVHRKADMDQYPVVLF